MGDIGFTAEELAAAERAIISSNKTEVHYRYDGGAPSGTVGLMLGYATGDLMAIVVGQANVANLQFVKEALGADGTISIQLEKCV